MGSPHGQKYYFQKLKERMDKQSMDDKSIKEANGNGNLTGKPPSPNIAANQVNATEAPGDESDKLVLMPEEVIFLSFGVGCLSIQDSLSLDMLSYSDVWKLLVQQNPEFPFTYAVYHYFRSKNWVPKTGTQFGGDYRKTKSYQTPLYFISLWFK